MWPPTVLGDAAGALGLCFGVVSAVLDARRSGRGRVVDAAIVDVVGMLGTIVQAVRANGQIDGARPSPFYDSPFYDAYVCADGRFITIGALEPKFYAALLNKLQLDDVDPAAQYDRNQWPALKTRFTQLFASYPSDHWCRLLEGGEVCFGPVLSIDEAIEHPHNQPAAWPVAAHAQQPGRLRRVGVLMSWNESDPEIKTFLSGFMQGLAELGWTDGGNVRMEVRWAGGNAARLRMFAKELVDLQPDVILATSTPATAALQQATRTIPIVFAGISDPVGAGFVANLSRPGGNLTGFINMEGTFAGKWLEVLREIAPGIKRAAIMFNPDTAPGGGSYYLPSFDAAARKLNVEPMAASVRSVAEIETVITSLGREPGGSLIGMPDVFVETHRGQIILLAARNNVPAIYSQSVLTRDGGLLSYGADRVDIFRRSASYVDHILRGAKPAELPVQLPTKFEMTINVKTAKSLGLDVPLFLQQRADEVIE